MIPSGVANLPKTRDHYTIAESKTGAIKHSEMLHGIESDDALEIAEQVDI
jgi:hypothetical protein